MAELEVVPAQDRDVNDDAYTTGNKTFAQRRVRRRIGLAALTRTDQLDIVAAREQRLDHKPYGARNAVDLRRIGFGDDRDAQPAARPSGFPVLIHGRGQCAPQMKPV